MRVLKNISHCFVFICHKKKKASIFHLCVIEERYFTSTRIMGSELSMHWWGPLPQQYNPPTGGDNKHGSTSM